MPRLLLVDDNATLAYFTSINLRNALPTLEVYAVGSCEEAKVAVKSFRPSCFVVDWRLPDGDGIELVRELIELTPGAFAIMTSAEAASSLEFVARSAGAVAVLEKPFEVDELVAAIRRGLDAASIDS